MPSLNVYEILNILSEYAQKTFLFLQRKIKNADKKYSKYFRVCIIEMRNSRYSILT